MTNCQCEAFEGILALLAKTPVASEEQTKTSATQASNGPCDTPLEAGVQLGKTVNAAPRDDKAKTTFGTEAAFDGKSFACIIH